MSRSTVTLSCSRTLLPACEDKLDYCVDIAMNIYRGQLSGNIVRLITMCKDDRDTMENGAKRQKGIYWLNY